MMLFFSLPAWVMKPTITLRGIMLQAHGVEKRRVTRRAKCSFFGKETRYVVTSLTESGAKYLYKTVYYGRGNAANYITESKLGTGSDRCSCHPATTNQFRMLLQAAACAVMHNLKTATLKGTEFENASFARIRLRLLKVASRIEVKKTVVRFHLPRHFKHKYELTLIARTVTRQIHEFRNTA